MDARPPSRWLRVGLVLLLVLAARGIRAELLPDTRSDSCPDLVEVRSPGARVRVEGCVPELTRALPAPLPGVVRPCDVSVSGAARYAGVVRPRPGLTRRGLARGPPRQA